MFFFVGANSFSQKFRLKHQESDATEDVQNSGNLGISTCDKKFLTVAWNSFHWQEVSFCYKKFLHVTRNFLLWQEMSSCNKKFLTMAWNSFLWEEVSFCDKKFLLMARNFVKTWFPGSPWIFSPAWNFCLFFECLESKNISIELPTLHFDLVTKINLLWSLV